MTAAELMDEARDYHPSFNKVTVPLVLLRRRLAAAQRAIVRAVTELDEEALAVPDSVVQADILTALEAGTGIVLPAGATRVLGDIKAKYSTRPDLIPVDLIAYANRDVVEAFPAVWFMGGRLFPIDKRDYGSPEHGWEYVERITLSLVIAPAEITDDAADLPLPDVARDALVQDLVLFMSRRTGVAAATPEEVAGATRAAVEAITSMGRAAHLRVVKRH